MRNFGRALADAFGFWPLLLVATLCSVGNGAIWGLNIGALFPVVEVTIAGESLQDWIQDEIAESHHRIAELESQIDDTRKGANSDLADSQLKLELLQTRLDAEKAGLESSLRLKPYIDRYLPHHPMQTVLYVMAALMLLTALKHVFQYVNTVLVALVAARITRRIQKRIFAKAMGLDQASFANYGSSGFVAHITYTTTMLSNGITSVYGGAIREPLKLASCLIGAALICPRLLLLTMLVVPVVAGLLYYLSRSLKRVCHNLLERATGLHHVMHESLNHIKTVQAYCQESHEQARFDKATGDMQRFTMRMVSFNALNRPLTELLAIGMMATAICAGSYLVMYRATEIFGIQITDRPLGAASMLVFFGMLVGASDPVRKLSSVIEGINTGAVAANLLYPMLDQVSRIESPADPITTRRPHQALRFEGVHFGYDASQPILQNVSLRIPHGANVAVIGANGTGKSSMINLICRFYDPDSGAVFLDEADIRMMPLEDLRNRIALVTQNTELFNEDLYYNIGYGADDASREQIVAAARAAHAEAFIRNELPNQFDTIIGQDGNRLSGGQRQRIALARALVRDPDILILDEATSQIDAESEQLIFDTIRNECRNRTVIFVTHRKNMLAIADIVLTVDAGSIHAERRLTARTGQPPFRQSDAA
jgi:ATP-binding cassette subfamily B protein/subfamily B ATP-binding cassette protein MsbA